MIRDYVGIAYEYAIDVTNDRVPACIFIKQACKRFLQDCDRKDIELKLAKVESVCMFVEKLKHIKGKWARTPIVLEPWQIFILVNVFGWYYVKTGKRRFRNVYLEVPRKNAKSTLTSGVGLYMTGVDGEGGAEVYSAATTRDQARIVFLDAKRMVDKNPELRENTGLSSAAHAIVHEDSSSIFRAVSADAQTLDGLNVYAGLIDELHAHKTRDVLEVLETGTGSRENPIIWTITTAGANIASVCYERREYAKLVLAGDSKDESTDAFFTMIYTVDEGDDWKVETTWIKANPNYGISVNASDLRIKARGAQQSPGKLAGFQTKHLNIWGSSAASWIHIDKWDACKRDIDWSEFGPDMCWLGLDLASTRDIAALQFIFRRNSKWWTFGKYYIPEEVVEEDGNPMYKTWMDQGVLTMIPGPVIDQDVIKEDILAACREFDVQNLAYDPFQASKLIKELTDLNVPCIEVGQTFKNLSEPMKLLEKDIITQAILHDGNAAMKWMISNVVEKRDGKDNVQPAKEIESKKIDGPVALIMGLAVAQRDIVAGRSAYDVRKSLFL